VPLPQDYAPTPAPRSPFRALLLALQFQLQASLAASLDLDPSSVYLTVDDPGEVPLAVGERDVVVRVLGEVPDAAAVDGGGRAVNLRTRRVQVWCRSRVLLDQAGQAAALLTDQTLGHLAFEDATADALELFLATDTDDPTGETGNALGLPLRVGPLSDPRRLSKDREWVASGWEIAVTYLRALDQSRQ